MATLPATSNSIAPSTQTVIINMTAITNRCAAVMPNIRLEREPDEGELVDTAG